MAHIPSAPDLSELQRRFLRAGTEEAAAFLFGPALDDSRYFHWSELAHRPHPAGMTREQWWLRLKLQRGAQQRSVALRQKNGSPFTVALTDEVLALTDEIARRAGGSVIGGGAALNTQGRDRFVVRSLVEEAITSSQLEGATTSRRAAIEMIDSARPARDRSEQMILNNYGGLRLVADIADDPLTPETVLELHRILTQDTLDNPDDAGRLETGEGERVRVWYRERVVHTPPPAGELPERLRALCAFANGTPADSPYIPPIVRAIITHFMFGYDHYFADGNGRLARAAFTWSMLHNGYWLAEFLAISTILRKAPAEYGRSYEYTEDDDGDLTYFVLHQLRVIRRALDQLDAYIASRREETQRLHRVLRDHSREFSPRQIQILEWLVRETPDQVTAIEVSNRYRVTTQTARNDLRHLEASGLLTRGTSHRPLRWIPAMDLSDRIAALGKQ